MLALQREAAFSRGKAFESFLAVCHPELPRPFARYRGHEGIGRNGGRPWKEEKRRTAICARRVAEEDAPGALLLGPPTLEVVSGHSLGNEDKHRRKDHENLIFTGLARHFHSVYVFLLPHTESNNQQISKILPPDINMKHVPHQRAQQTLHLRVISSLLGGSDEDGVGHHLPTKSQYTELSSLVSHDGHWDCRDAVHNFLHLN